MKQRLIDANALMDKLPDEWNKYPNRDVKYTTGITIAGMPTIDPIEHGRWLYDKYEHADTLEKCSICNYHRLLLGGKPKDYFAPNYCPNCGAKMDEVTE